MTQISAINVDPYFDLEDFMNHSRESRIEGPTLQTLMDLWEDWLNKVAVRQIQSGKQSWLAVWLPEEVEKLVDEAWQNSPSQGYLINSLAQYMNMAIIREVLPQIVEGNCAPAPAPSRQLAEALSLAGLEYGPDGQTMQRRYATVTHYPYKGGCEICNLRSECPRGSNKTEFASVVLPGYERGANE